MTDALCLDDLDPNGTELDEPVAELEQDSYHRIIEAPASNPDDLDRGFGAYQRLNGVLDPTTGAQLEHELLKDDRAHAVKATVSLVEDNGNRGVVVRVDAQIEPEGEISALLTVGTGG